MRLEVIAEWRKLARALELFTVSWVLSTGVLYCCEAFRVLGVELCIFQNSCFITLAVHALLYLKVYGAPAPKRGDFVVGPARFLLEERTPYIRTMRRVVVPIDHGNSRSATNNQASKLVLLLRRLLLQLQIV